MMQKNIYDHIKSNNRKTALLVLCFPLVFLVLVFLFVWIALSIHAEPGAAIMPTVISTTIAVGIPTMIAALIWLLISWAFGDSMMLNAAGASEIKQSEREYAPVFRAVENVAIAAGLPTPRVYIIEDDSLNAFATGRSPADASVALTRGIIAKLNPLELQGVIAHEMAHIGNRDIRLDMMLITGVGVTVFMADIVLRMLWSGTGNRGENDNGKDRSALVVILIAVWLAFLVFNWIVAPILRMAVSRTREFQADATGAFITRNPRALASALRKISVDPRVEVLDKRQSMAAVCIEDPRAPRAFFGELYATHPKTEERIKRLESM